ncbi:MAG TPA: hypothetical protein VGM14_15385 [Streptosporangiaceae bacterium]|jgi:hypothetical protein
MGARAAAGFLHDVFGYSFAEVAEITGITSRPRQAITLTERVVNGQPGLVAQEAGGLVCRIRTGSCLVAA